MFCPNCGTENTDGAKFCKSCGKPFDVKVADELSDEPKDQAAFEEQTKVTDESASSAKSEPIGAREQMTDIKTKLTKMPKKTVLIAGAVAVLVVAVIAVFAAGMNQGPSDSDIENAVKQMGIEERVPASSMWEDVEDFSIQSVKVLQKDKETGDIQSFNRTGMPVSDPYTVKVEAVLSNGSTEITEQMPLCVAKANGEWKLITFNWSDISVTSTNLLKGVDQERVEKSFEFVLDDVETTGKNRMDLIYKDATYKVQKETFDADKKTDELVIKCTAKNTFYDATAKVTALFKYGKKGWELESAKADKDAQKRDYQKLIGTWTGKFKEQPTAYKNCFGGQANPIKINITGVDQETGKVDGTITALMHFHQMPSADQDSDAGDFVATDIPFSLANDLNGSEQSIGGSIDYKRDDESTATIYFSIKSDESTASVVCDYTGGTGLLNWWTYMDDFTLSKDK